MNEHTWTHVSTCVGSCEHARVSSTVGYGELNGWHSCAAGKLSRKQNVFDDMHSAAEYLIRNK